MTCGVKLHNNFQLNALVSFYIITDKCSFPKFTGHCNANLDRWFYNMETGVCEEFVYGGCRGNMNNFESFEECEQSCVPNGKMEVCLYDMVSFLVGLAETSESENQLNNVNPLRQFTSR